MPEWFSATQPFRNCLCCLCVWIDDSVSNHFDGTQWTPSANAMEMHFCQWPAKTPMAMFAVRPMEMDGSVDGHACSARAKKKALAGSCTQIKSAGQNTPSSEMHLHQWQPWRMNALHCGTPRVVPWRICWSMASNLTRKFMPRAGFIL